jgi:hypothetical protein
VKFMDSVTPATEQAKAGEGSSAVNQNARNLFLWLVVFVLTLIVANEIGLRIPGAVVVSFVIGLPISVLLLEGGHVLAAVMFRFKLFVIAIWPFQFSREPTGWRIGIWHPESRGAAFVSALPIGTDNLRKRFIFLIAGGPATSFLVGIAATALTWQYPRWAGIAFWSLFLGVIMSRRLTSGDSKFLRVLLADGKEAERLTAAMALLAASFEGLRPRNWDPDLIRRASEPLDDSSDALGAQHLRYNWLQDTGQLEEARSVLVWLLSHSLPKAAETSLRMETIWLEARYFGNLDGARATLDREGNPGKNPAVRCTYFKAKSAVHLLESNWLEAEVAAAEALRACDEVENAGVAIAIREEVEGVLSDVRSAKLAAAPTPSLPD